MNGKTLKKEFGDYQTPYNFSELVCVILKNELKLSPKTIIEPTCGVGNFIKSSSKFFPDAEKIFGVEINSDYCDICKNENPSKKISIINSDFFNFDSSTLFNNEETLFIGNPPWATNSELNFNLPEKVNFKKLSGTDAITGSSNFDICEYMILQIINNSIGKNVSIAMLCKTSVARNVLTELERNKIFVSDQRMYNFDANKIFDISASACLLYLRMGKAENNTNICNVFYINKPTEIVSKIECTKGNLRYLLDKETPDLEGICEYTWRQGVKHDCSSIMELTKEGIHYKNKKGDSIDIEENYVYPLVKSSSFKDFILKDKFSKFVIVTQKKAREETASIEKIAPKTWKYLNLNKELFEKRKSSIYVGAPDFSMFGVGDYSYSKYKVGISGFYKKPVFSLIYNESDLNKPIMFDDTSYFLSFEKYDNAYVCMILLNSDLVQKFLLTISFQDSKRPFTKKVLQRISIKKCMDLMSFEKLKNEENKLSLNNYLTESMYKEFSKIIP